MLKINENEPGSKKKISISKTSDGKQILRNMTRYIPKKVTQAQKQGFSSPDASWFKGESIDFVHRRLLGSNVKLLNTIVDQLLKY